MSEVTRKVWRSEALCLTAESLEAAEAWSLREFCYDPQEYPFEPKPLPDDEVVSTHFYDGAEDDRDYPAWVDNEPKAVIEWVKQEGWNGSMYTSWKIAKVSAPAHIWAQIVDGLIYYAEV